MKISTRGRYAVCVMVDLAEHNSGEYIPLADIARRQGISGKYLETIVAMLVKNEMLTAIRGKGGGYRLTKRPEEYSVASILKVTEGSFAPVDGLENGKNQCGGFEYRKTQKLWEDLQALIDNYLENITLEDLLDNEISADNYII